MAIDYSNAVDATYANLRQYPNLHVCQADIYHLPFAPGAFRYIYSLGVLQHTPKVAQAFAALPPLLAPGGELVVDVYQKTLASRFLPKRWLRPLTTRMPANQLFSVLERSVPPLLWLSCRLRRIPKAGRLLSRLVPVANDFGELCLTKQQLREWALLDTFDWLSPAYDQSQTPETLRKWFQQSGLTHIMVAKIEHLVGRGVKQDKN